MSSVVNDNARVALKRLDILVPSLLFFGPYVSSTLISWTSMSFVLFPRLDGELAASVVVFRECGRVEEMCSSCPPAARRNAPILQVVLSAAPHPNLVFTRLCQSDCLIEEEEGLE